MSDSFDLELSGNFKYTLAQHRQWRIAAFSNGESYPRVVGAQVQSSADIYTLGIIPTFVLTSPSTTSSGTSTAGTYGIILVYRSTLFQDGLTGDDIQSDQSNIVDVTLAANEAAVLTKVVSTDTKVNALDIYAAQKISGVYGAFYRVVKDGANSAGTITFNIQISNTFPIGAGVSNGTSDATFEQLDTDNDFPTCQPILLEVAGRLVSMGGIVKRVSGTWTNGSSTVTTTTDVFDGIQFWNIKRDSDTSGGIDGRGTYLCRYDTVNSVVLVNADGTSATYSGSTGSDTGSIWTEPNRKFSKLLNPHAFPFDNINNDYPSAILAAGKMPNTNRVLIMGKDWVIAEDYDVLPMTSGLNYVSSEYGCSSHFSVVAAHGRLYWLDFGGGKREICVSDGSTVQPISTRKIKSILQRITLDENADPWRIGYIHGAYFRNEDTIRWGLYLDNNTVANYVLELDLNSGEVRSDPSYYGLRYMDVFTYGTIRGRVYIGQFGFDGGIARIGVDNMPDRYRDWVPSGTLSGDLDDTGQTTAVLTATGSSFATTGDGLVGIQVMVWKERDPDDDDNLVVNPTYYHCRISENTADTFTINYVETMDSTGLVSAVGTELPETPADTGWKFAIGVIQGLAGPKFFVSPDNNSALTFRQMVINTQGQDLTEDVNPIKVHMHENLDKTPRDVQYLESIVQAEQVADPSLSSSGYAKPTTNPVLISGFTIADNNVSEDETSLSIETIALEFSEDITQDDQQK